MNRINSYAAVLAVACLVGFLFQGAHGLLESTEGRYAEAAREMLETGNWLVPQLDYQPHWTKPPLTYWAIMGGMAVFGENEWGVRFYNAVAFVALVWVVTRIGERLWDRHTGLLAGLFYATAPYAVYAASSVHTDILLSLWEACIVLAYWEARTAPTPRRAAGWVGAFWVFMGLAFLTKGPPGLLTPAAVVAYECYTRWLGRARVRLMRAGWIAVFLAIGGAWFGIVIWRTPGLLAYFVDDEVVGRVFTAHFDRNPHWYAPLYVYGVPLTLGLGPIVLVWLAAAKRYGKGLRWPAIRDYVGRHEHGAFLLVWLILPLAVLSLSQSRLPLYILPMFPAVVLATARLLTVAFARPGLDRRVWMVAAAMAVVLVGAKGALEYMPIAADMWPLYGFTQGMAGHDTTFLCYESTRLYGLQFYRHGQLTRLWKKPLANHPETGVEAALDAMIAHPAHDTYVFVTTAPTDCTEMETLLHSKAIAADKINFRRKYDLFVVHPARRPGATA